MKLIHTADLHLASKLESRFTKEQAKTRRNELFETFRRLADEAVRIGARAVLISGDVFDESRISRSMRGRFIDIVAQHPTVDFLCLAGNHDESLAGEEGLPENLVTFGEDWKCVSYDGTDVYGAELDADNCAILYTALRPDPARTNIVMLHGQVVQSNGTPDEHSVILPRLRDLSIDYLALGHIHSYRCDKLDSRGVWCYSGCLEGRGYDECGEKGYVLLEIDGREVKSSFVPFAKRTIHEVFCDLTGAERTIGIEERVLEAAKEIPEKDLVRMILTGRIPMDLQVRAEELESILKEKHFDAEVKKELKPIIYPEELRDLLSLKGEFIRTVSADPELTEEQRDRVILCGLLALQDEDLTDI